MTLREAIDAARRRLTAAGIADEEAGIDVDLFVRTILGWDRARVIVEQSAPAPAALEPAFSASIERRSHHEPTAYIVGHKEFWGLDFLVTPAVLVPRPETEAIVEMTLDWLRRTDAPARPRIADVGTGSGCIAVSLAYDWPQCHIVATDVSDAALAVARENASRHGVADRIEFRLTAYLDDVPDAFDVIMTNPPYIPDAERDRLPPAVRHEPASALFAGPDGLEQVSGVLAAADLRLRPGGALILEFGYGQSAGVQALVRRHPALRLMTIRHDLQGIPRTAWIERLDIGADHEPV